MNNVEMFDKIAKTYDRNTFIISLGIEHFWRKIFVKKLKTYIENVDNYLDVASATGDMFKFVEAKNSYFLEPSSEMISIAKRKLKDKNINYIQNGAEDFAIDKKFDLITIFMGVRNFDNIEKGISNIDKHLKSGGIMAITELTTPESKNIFYILSDFYMSKIVPILGGILSGNFQAYKQFPKSIKKITDEDILKYLENYEILEHSRLFPPLASIIILKKK